MSNWSEAAIETVWNKGKVVTGQNKDEWRKDIAGAWMNRNKHGDNNSDYGCEIDHKKPLSKGGAQGSSLDTDNLQPLQWQNNRTKGDDYPNFSTSITSSGNKNIEKKQNWTFK